MFLSTPFKLSRNGKYLPISFTISCRHALSFQLRNSCWKSVFALFSLHFWRVVLSKAASEAVRCGIWRAHLWHLTALETTSDSLKSHKWQPESTVLTSRQNVRKTETVDFQSLAKTSFFGHFSTNIPFTSNESPFLGPKIRNLFDKRKSLCW